MLDICLLGTGGMMPLPYRWLTSMMARYNGTRGTWKGMKWFFYFFYVGHLVLFGLLRLWLNGNVATIVG